MITKVEYIEKKPPNNLLEGCKEPAIVLSTYRDGLIGLAKYKASLKKCVIQQDALNKFYK